MLQDGEEINITRRIITTDPVPLLNPHTKQLAPQARAIFTEWFDEFAKPKDTYENKHTAQAAYLAAGGTVEAVRALC